MSRDHLTRAQRSAAMSRVKLRNGSLEQIVQTHLQARGFDILTHVAIPGRPDIAFVRQKVAVFVDGNFWHGYRLPQWEHKLKPFWREKLQKNRQRDQRNFRKLRRMGWCVVRIWEHELKSDQNRWIRRLEAKLELNGNTP